jgi:hypothetical protein
MGFIGPSGQADVLATDADAAGTIPVAGTISALYGTVDSFATGSVVVTLYLNGAPTSLTCTLASGTTGDSTCSATGTITVTAGNTVSVQITNNTSPNSFLRDIRWSAALGGS